jgi:uracil-DNA glycosylase family 4
MMATRELLKAYLDWQAEMGTDEVILPHPLLSKSAGPAAVTASLPLDSAPSTRMAPGSAAMRYDEAGLAQPHFAAPDDATPLSGPHGSAASSDLYASLSQALEKAAKPGSGDRLAPGSPGNAGGIGSRLSDAASLPAFADLSGFWTHLEANPHLATGEMAMAEPLRAAEGAKALLTRGTGPTGAPLALIGFEPSEADALAGQAFQGDAGALLEKMIRAIRMDMQGLYRSNLIKVRTGKAWNRRELARLLPVLHAELGLARAPLVLLLGQECAQAVLKTGKTLDELRQETHRLEGREFFVTYHPQELLRKEELKRKAWEDLQWLQRRMAEAQART